MHTNVRSSRWSQAAAWAVAGLFILGFFFPLVGRRTSPILGVWFVSTQKPRRGFLWMVAFSFFPSLLTSWREFPLAGVGRVFAFVGAILLTAVLGVLPFTFHRLASPRLPGLLSTLPLPLAAVVFQFLLQSLPQVGAARGTGLAIFLINWFAAVIVWMWNHEFRRSRIAVGAGLFALIFIPAIGFELLLRLRAVPLPAVLSEGAPSAWLCLGAALVLSAWALMHREKRQSWTGRPKAVALLQSPYTGEPLQVDRERSRESLVSPSGERFPIHDGIPLFLHPEELTGSNRKYNRLYETIGGFYDDIQRVHCGLRGFDRDAYFLSYMRLLEVKPGDSVLETSVGTGLNFQYLPLGVKLSGLDLSPEMLANCQSNLRRWQLDADLFLGNAETLPFTDSSFDVVFHVGGINFFNDRSQAIREMIRVAKPGSLLLIADETEEYVKSMYEKQPGSLYKNRKQPVTAPIDLVPPEMQDVHLELLKDGMFYALTLRKPRAA